jgi:hypothetical protein
MSGARVQSIDALKHFRAALIKFAEVANVALGDAEGEINRIVMWLGHEQQQFWQTAIRKRQELVARAAEAVRAKKIFKDSSGRQQSAVDEEKQLLKAQRALQEAEQKLIATKRHYQRLQKEMHMYKGATTRLLTAVTSDLPNAVAMLNRMTEALEGYVNITSDAVELPIPSAGGEDSMAMSADGATQAEINATSPTEGPQGEGTPTEREGLPSEESRQAGLKEADLNAEQAPPQGAASTEAPTVVDAPAAAIEAAKATAPQP